MSFLKSAIKYKTVKTVTDKTFGKGTLSTLTAASLVKKSNARGKTRKQVKGVK